MKNQDKKTELVNVLTENILTRDNSNKKFKDFDESIESDVRIHRIYKTERNLGVRTLCVVLDLPNDISDEKDLYIFFRKIRNSLTKKYAKFPYWKELGIISIILCDNSNYERLKNKINKLKDASGLHMNVMLGTFLVNIEKLEYTETKTWGLVFSGIKHRLIKQTLTDWTNRN